MLRNIVAFVHVAAAALAAAPHAASAFGTVHLLGQNAEHEQITRLALKSFGLGPKTMTAIAGTRGTFGGVGAPDNPARGLMGQKSAHCDGGDALDVPGYPQSAAQAQAVLEACRAVIFRYLDQAVREAGALVDGKGGVNDSQVPTLVPCVFDGKPGRAKCNALESLGVAFHAAQDFYSHSNWVDRPAPGPVGALNPPGLGMSGRAPWLDPRVRGKAPEGLITGCFEGIPESSKCSYGGGKDRIRHKALNKDTGKIDPNSGAIQQGTTERGRINDNFVRAVRAAVDDTRDKWAYFEARVRSTYGEARGRVIVCVMRSDDPSGCR